MTEVLEQFLNELLASSALEIMAVSLALAYLILAVRENIWFPGPWVHGPCPRGHLYGGIPVLCFPCVALLFLVCPL